MLTSTFVHIPRVGYSSEQKIWASGNIDWETFDSKRLSGSNSKKLHIKKFVDLSIESYDKQNYQFFSSLLKKQEHWRALKDFSKIAYLDIETTGLSKDYDDITMIGVYDGHKTRTFIKGKNLADFKGYSEQFQLFVTFNGSCFDLPFIENKFSMRFDQLHVDLRFVLGRLGYTGGLKKIEKVFDLQRSKETQSVDGFEAVRLWHRYVKGDDSALELLKRYNTEDVVGLKVLANKSYDMLKEKVLGDYLSPKK